MEKLLALYAAVNWELVAWCLAGYGFASEYIGNSAYFKNNSVIQYAISPVKQLLLTAKGYIDKYILKKS